MNDVMERLHQGREVHKCYSSALYFIENYGLIYDATDRAWLPFRLWPAQVSTLKTIQDNRLVCILKARQLGLTWLVIGFALWLMLFCPAATVLLFSRRDDEATDLLKTRLRGMYDHLPGWLKVRSIRVDNDHEWALSNDSRALAFPTTAGDSYSATLAIVDEADLVPDLEKMMKAVKPTIDADGRMILLSRADKSRPESLFKKIYASAKARKTEWQAVFLPWDSRPERNRDWYEKQKKESLQHTGALDALHEQYPATDFEALAPRSLDKRIPYTWLQQCYVEAEPLTGELHPAIPGLSIYAPPAWGRTYVIGADPAEGNPSSDDSALVILDIQSGEEVATLAGKFQPAVFATHIDTLGRHYNNARVLCERNNHGHAVLIALDHCSPLQQLPGRDQHPGWLSNSVGKALLYDSATECFRSQETILHSFATMCQLASIDGSSLRAPEGQADDRADAYALACVAMQELKRLREMEAGDVFAIGRMPCRYGWY